MNTDRQIYIPNKGSHVLGWTSYHWIRLNESTNKTNKTKKPKSTCGFAGALKPVQPGFARYGNALPEQVLH